MLLAVSVLKLNENDPLSSVTETVSVHVSVDKSTYSISGNGAQASLVLSFIKSQLQTVNEFVSELV